MLIQILLPIFMKQTYKLSKNDLRNMISETLKRILNEADTFNLNDYISSNNEMITFILHSDINGNLNFQVPYEEFINSKYKLDYLWEKCAEQYNLKVIRNGYFTVAPNDPHKTEIERFL